MRPRLLILLMIALIKSQGVVAQDGTVVNAFHCASVSNDIARLECFDKAYDDYRKAAEAPGNWKLRTEVNPMDDMVTIIAAVEDDNSGSNYLSANHLAIRCENNELSVWVAWSSLLLIDDTEITYRVGQESPKTATWIPSTDKTGTFYPGQSRELIERMLKADRFVVRFASGKHKGETAVFDVKGLDNVMKPMQTQCLPSRSSERDRLVESLAEHLKNNPALREKVSENK